VATGALRLYSYWRSSAAYRVRIALNLKGLPYEIVPVHLVNGGGEQHSEEYRQVNPQELVPTLQDGHRIVRQSMAIIEYLEETWPDPPLMPDTSRDRVRVRTLSQIIACEIHPLNNLRVLQFLEHTWNVPQAERELWIRHWMQEGFRALEATLADSPATGTYCEGDFPTMADCLLVPQVYNAVRFGLDLSPYPTIARINEDCLALEAFQNARPENQPDAPAV
jgi:maleylacetoacetate isomerase